MKLILNASTSSVKADGRSDSFNFPIASGSEEGTVVPESQRAINAHGRALLNRFNQPDPLVEQMVASKTGQFVVNI